MLYIKLYFIVEVSVVFEGHGRQILSRNEVYTWNRVCSLSPCDEVGSVSQVIFK